ncbi:helix-turn-helix domain-containing protein [Streptomyces guryensis]|uniref:Helix-turn-helix domain-containing protein n=1 Tax=Streptomyces guryensis TaxID=2886947 RepID=A0A9Q3Z9C7_9ACTN|nr:helix-turn-helix transcriptional regulator [Streptomyces guryensis]MCD9878174.1 helix-turn-helix domain-containing protein [Streptomyces guryensis]
MPNVRAKPTLRRRRLGGALKGFRAASGLTLEAAAVEMGWDSGKLSRIENAKAHIWPKEIPKLLGLYGIEDLKVISALEELARDAGKQGWWQTYGNIIGGGYQDYMFLESDAVGIRVYCPGLVHGLLQTVAYAREVIAATAITRSSDEVAALTEVRQARQAVLTRPGRPLKIWAVIHEAALRQQFPTQPNVMTHQLQRLLDLSEMPTIDVQVMPIGASPHPGMTGPFDIVSFGGPWPTVVNLENLRGGFFMEGEDVAVFEAAFERTVAAALPVDVSREAIKKIMDEGAHQ